MITLEGDSSADAGSCGSDEAAGTLIIHDPSSFRTTEYLLESIGKDTRRSVLWVWWLFRMRRLLSLINFSLRAMSAPSLSASKLLVQTSPWSQAATLIAEDLPSRYPHHPVTAQVQASQALLEGKTAKALVGYQKLTSDYPNAAFVRSNVLAIRAMQNTAVMREVLSAVVEHGALPGVQSQHEWQYPPAAYVSEYAVLLMASSETHNKARSLLHSLIRRQPSYGQAWHILGDLLWQDTILMPPYLLTAMAPALSKIMNTMLQRFATC